MMASTQETLKEKGDAIEKVLPGTNSLYHSTESEF